MRLPVAFQSYRHRDLPVSAQRCLNWFAEAQPAEAKARVVLLPTPGLGAFSLLATGPARGVAEMAGYQFWVSGTGVYRVDASGASLFLGNIADGGAVTMAANGTQCMIVVPETGQGWIATTSALTQITDADFPPSSSVTDLDGFFIVSRADSTQFAISALRDGFTWDALDFASAEASPDNLVRTIRVGRELWMIGEKTTEMWFNAGSADFPFQRVNGAFIERGCAARDSVATINGVVFWLGQDRVVYRSQGASAQRISHHAMEQAIAGYSTAADARAWCYEQEGHTFYVLSFPISGETWVYDLSTQAWHERESEGRGIWRCIVGANYAGATVAGDSLSGQLYIVDPTLATEVGDLIIRVADGIVAHNENKRLFFTRYSLDCKTGVGLTSGQGSDPQIWLSYSDDGGRTWSNEMYASLGAIGQHFHQVDWRRLGASRERVFRVQMSDPVRTVLMAANVDVEPGE